MKPTHLALAAILVAMAGPGNPALGQNQLSNWHFGNGISMNFNGGTITTGTSALNASGINQPSILSDANGNVICYTDGNKVYNGSDTEIHDFTSTTPENLIVPHPGGNDRYYLFRSGNDGLNYSIIDMTLNGGVGGINEDEEDIEIADENCQLVCSRNYNGIDWWLVSADNNNGNTDDVTFTVYAVTADGVTAGDSEGQYYLFGGWYVTLDDMRLAPDCSKIVVAYKGHYLVLIKFDNQTGMLSDLLATSLDAGNSFGTADLDQWEFSADGNYLFDLEDHSGITRYNLETWTLAAIDASEEIIIPYDWGAADTWTDLKLAIDGKIYLYNTADMQIDAISNTSDPLDDVEVTYAVTTFENGLTSFFPNLTNVSCISLDAVVFHQYECLGDSTELWYSFTLQADSVLWDFGDPSTGDDNTSTLDEPIHIFSATGSYTVILTVYFEGDTSTYDHEVNIYTVPPLELGSDLEFCLGEDATIGPAPVPGLNYSWSSGQSTSTIEVTQSGTYELTVTNVGCQVSDEVDVTVFSPIYSGLQEQVVLCEQGPYVLEASAENADSYQWSTGASSESITVNGSGTYWVTASNECFSSTDTTTITYVIIPELMVEPVAQACFGDTLLLTSNYANGEIEWSTGENTAQIEVTESGIYTVTAEYLGCTREDQIEVIMEEFIPLSWIEMPNIFTPDQSGKNELFRPFVLADPDYPLCTSAVVEVKMNVYNRWGNLLAEDVCSWDGKAPDSDISHEGVYYYIVEITSACYKVTEEEKRDGYVHLLTKE